MISNVIISYALAISQPPFLLPRSPASSTNLTTEAAVGRVDFAFANAAVTEQGDYFSDVFDEDGQLCEPDASFHRVLDVNLKAVVYFVKMARSMMRRHGTHGSIVITTSATAYAPEQSLPVYAAAKTGVGYPLSLIRFPTITGSYWLS
jgi:NAD(P)-dependent dehydrogenase (short-subunit alcohol dehydrogenase family)